MRHGFGTHFDNAGIPLERRVDLVLEVGLLFRALARRIDKDVLRAPFGVRGLRDVVRAYIRRLMIPDFVIAVGLPVAA